jgi:hypothetical protein
LRYRFLPAAKEIRKRVGFRSCSSIGDIKALAEQLKTALPLLEQEVRVVDAKLRRANILCGFTLGVAMLALVVGFIALLSK